jgi:hypothetical protein
MTFVAFDSRTVKFIPDILAKIRNNTSLLDDFTLDSTVDHILLKYEFNPREDNTLLSFKKLLRKHFIFSVYPDNKCYINMNPKERKMPEIVAHYGMIFILGDIVRYKPDKVFELLENEETQSRWFWGKLCDTAERIYPNLVLNTLYGRTYKFSHY